MTNPNSDPLIDAARALHREKGARLTLSELAARAGVSRATLYQRLGGKAQVLALLAQEGPQPDLPTDIDSRIMQGVLQSAAQRGFRGATLDDIADSAGVGVATIYRRFGDKDGLIRAFIKAIAPATWMPDLPDDTGSVRSQLSMLVRFLLQRMHDHRALLRLVFSGSAEDRAYLRGLRESQGSSVARIAAFLHVHQDRGALSAQVSAQDLATNLFGMMYAHAVQSDRPEPFDVDAAAQAILPMFDGLIVGDAP